MSAMVMLADCFSCGKPFMSNPELVPSVPICQGCQRPPDLHADDCDRTFELVKQPLCRDCVNGINQVKRERGEPLVIILPGAYEPQVIE